MGAHFSFFSLESPIPLSSSSSDSSNVLSITDRLISTRVSISLVAAGNLLSPVQLRAQIMRQLELIKAEARLFVRRLPRCKHRGQAALPPLVSIFVTYRACGRVRLMLRCVAFACQRLATAPADMHMMYRLRMWSWAEVAMERVTRGRVKRVQVRLQRRVCCAVLCAALVTISCQCLLALCF